MKWLLMAVLVVGQAAWAAGSPSFQAGLEGYNAAYQADEPLTQTEKLLKRQAQSARATESELPTDLYVKSQKRVSDSFTTKIPESLSESTRKNQN